jgi:hypothetical protein
MDAPILREVYKARQIGANTKHGNETRVKRKERNNTGIFSKRVDRFL